MATRRKKLYFDISLVTVTAVVRACTQFRATYPGDLYGSVLEDFAPLTAGSSAALKQRNEVTAWFAPVSGQRTTSATTANSPYLNQSYYVRFVSATVTNNTDATTIPDGLVFGTQIQGSTPIGTRHFGVMVARHRSTTSAENSPTVRGRLYVQRQHQIEI